MRETVKEMAKYKYCLDRANFSVEKAKDRLEAKDREIEKLQKELDERGIKAKHLDSKQMTKIREYARDKILLGQRQYLLDDADVKKNGQLLEEAMMYAGIVDSNEHAAYKESARKAFMNGLTNKRSDMVKTFRLILAGMQTTKIVIAVSSSEKSTHVGLIANNY